MPPESIQQTMIFYTCPRPVVLVSVDDGTRGNLFPMDLIGPVSPDRFTLALRITSPSVEVMKATRRVALSDMPSALTPVIYKLGEHHKKQSIDWGSLPFQTARSGMFQLPYPENAMRVREMEIIDHETVGSHTFFITREVSETVRGAGPQLFHTNGNYQHFRARTGRGFQRAL